MDYFEIDIFVDLSKPMSNVLISTEADNSQMSSILELYCCPNQINDEIYVMDSGKIEKFRSIHFVKLSKDYIFFEIQFDL